MITEKIRKIIELSETGVERKNTEEETLEELLRAENPEAILENLEIYKDLRNLPSHFKTKIYETILKVRRSPALLRNYAYHILFNGKSQELKRVPYLLNEAQALEFA